MTTDPRTGAGIPEEDLTISDEEDECLTLTEISWLFETSRRLAELPARHRWVALSVLTLLASRDAFDSEETLVLAVDELLAKVGVEKGP